MTCDEARARVVALLRAAPADANARLPAEVLEHVAACLGCLQDLAVTGTAVMGRPSRLLADVAEGPTCDLLEPLLAELAQADVAGKDPRAASPLAWRHLETCAPCRAGFTELCETLRAADRGAFGVPPDREAGPTPLGGLFQVRAWLNDPSAKAEAGTSQGGLDAELLAAAGLNGPRPAWTRGEQSPSPSARPPPGAAAVNERVDKVGLWGIAELRQDDTNGLAKPVLWQVGLPARAKGED